MILTIVQLSDKLKSISQHQTVVLVTGVFDLLHSAHLKFLKKAKSCGDILLVGIESDARVIKLKGKDRPINPLNVRIKNISNLNFVDYVFALPEKFKTKVDFNHLLSLLKPNIYAASSHTPHLKIKQQLITAHGGQLKIVMSQDKSVSTTKLINSSHPKL